MKWQKDDDVVLDSRFLNLRAHKLTVTRSLGYLNQMNNEELTIVLNLYTVTTLSLTLR